VPVLAPASFLVKPFFLNFLTMAKLVATSSTGAIRKRPRRRIGEISRDVQRELDRLTKFERADLLMRVSCKLLPSIDG